MTGRNEVSGAHHGLDRSLSVGPAAELIDWFAPGDSTDVEVDGVRFTVRLVSRKGRRARIAITAPAGARFHARQIKDR